MGQRGHSQTETVTRLLQAIGLFIPLSETECNGGYQEEYNCSCHDTMSFHDTTSFMSYTGSTKLISKANCSVKTLYASLTSREAKINRQPQCSTA